MCNDKGAAPCIIDDKGERPVLCKTDSINLYSLGSCYPRNLGMQTSRNTLIDVHTLARRIPVHAMRGLSKTSSPPTESR